MTLFLFAALIMSGQTVPPPILRTPMPPPALAPRAPSRPVSDQDRAVVDLMISHDTFIDGNIKTFVASFDATNASNPAAQKMLTDNPGLRATLLAAAEPAMTKILEADYPGLRERFAQVFAEGLLPGDYAPVLAFLGSSAAAKSRAASYGESNQKLIANRSTANGTSGFTVTDSAAISANTVRETLQTLTPAEIGVTARFSASLPGRRFVLAQQRVSRISLEWANGLASRAAPINEAMTLAAQKFFRNGK